ncbi:class I tRNA ligase family protein, partial [Lactococcus lactis]|nr:class I tRNA ligase family protein [Lactococcus lactis]
MYNYIWSDFADWYIEMTKETLNGDQDKAPSSANIGLRYWIRILRLLHQSCHLLHEAIWQEMPASKWQ